MPMLDFTAEEFRRMAQKGWRFGGIAPTGKKWRMSPETFAKVRDRVERLDGWRFVIETPDEYAIDWTGAGWW